MNRNILYILFCLFSFAQHYVLCDLFMTKYLVYSLWLLQSISFVAWISLVYITFIDDFFQFCLLQIVFLFMYFFCIYVFLLVVYLEMKFLAQKVCMHKVCYVLMPADTVSFPKCLHQFGLLLVASTRISIFHFLINIYYFLPSSFYLFWWVCIRLQFSS